MTRRTARGCTEVNVGRSKPLIDRRFGGDFGALSSDRIRPVSNLYQRAKSLRQTTVALSMLDLFPVLS